MDKRDQNQLQQLNVSICIIHNFCAILFCLQPIFIFCIIPVKAIVPRRKFSSAWSAIEDVICDSLPSCVKTILSESGYDSLLSINLMNESIMSEVEHFVNENRDITAKLDCCFGHTYKNLQDFRFLPAHRLLTKFLGQTELRTQRKSLNKIQLSAQDAGKALLNIHF